MPDFFMVVYGIRVFEKEACFLGRGYYIPADVTLDGEGEVMKTLFFWHLAAFSQLTTKNHEGN